MSGLIDKEWQDLLREEEARVEALAGSLLDRVAAEPWVGVAIHMASAALAGSTAAGRIMKSTELSQHVRQYGTLCRSFSEETRRGGGRSDA
jgi:hypothetical protein